MTTLDIIYLVITGVSLIFSCYLYFRNPQVASEQTEAILALEIKQLKLDIVGLKETIVNLHRN